MKRYYAAAAALLLGTSALAWAGGDKPMVEPVDTSADASTMKPVDTTVDKLAFPAKSDATFEQDSKLELATLDKDLEKLAVAESDVKLASAESWGHTKLASADTWTDAKVETASFDDAKVQTASFDETKVETAWADTKVETAAVDKTNTGMGGPLEGDSVAEPSNANPELDARGIPVISDVAYVPTGYNGTGGAVGGPVEGGDDESYPACTRERTDNCIQLYERGVRQSLASAPAGSLADDSKTAAVGGPYEPVESDSTDLAMNGDGKVDAGLGEISDLGVQSAAATDSAVTTDTAVLDHSEHQGVGGPVEAQSGYPPCSPGPGDDRCIQLYERGVTGAGN